VCGAERVGDRHNGIYKDRDSGKAIGTVCQRCAAGIGFLGHDPDRLRRALMFITGQPVT
jgi:hypothetical protein